MPQYDAFISYSHSADNAMAPHVKAGLQAFAKPWFKLRAARVFLDGANLNLSPHLWQSIESALRESGHFLYMASPEAAASKWVGQELAWWSSQTRLDRMLIILTSGEMAWDDTAKDFDWTRTTCIPKSMSGAFGGEPFFLDLRWARTAQDLSLQNPKFKQAIALLSSTLRGVSLEDMVGAEVMQHRRTTRVRNAAIGTLALLLLIATVLAVLAVRASDEARRQEAQAVLQRDRALSAGLYNRVQTELESGALAQAVRLARAGLRQFGADPMAQRAQAEVIGHATPVLATVREPLDSQPQVEFSADGRQILSVFKGQQSALDARVRNLRGQELQAFTSVNAAQFTADGQHVRLQLPGAPHLEQEFDESICDAVDGQVLKALDGERTPRPADVHLDMGLQDLSANGQGQLSVCGNVLRWGHAGKPTLKWLLPGIRAARLSPDGRWIAAEFGSATRLLAIDSGSAAVTGAAPQPAGTVALTGTAPVFSPDSQAVATVQGGRTVVWGMAGEPRLQVDGGGPVFGPGGMLMTATGASSMLWRAGQAPVQFEGSLPRLSPDGQWVMTTLAGGLTRVAADTGQELARLDGVSGRFAPTGPVALTANAAGLVRLWDLRRVPASTPSAAARLWRMDVGELAALVPKRAQPEPPGACAGPGQACTPDGQTQVSVLAHAVTPGAPWTATLHFETLAPAGQATAALGSAAPDVGKTSCPGPVAPLALAPAAEHDVALGCGDGTVRVFSRSGVLRWEGRHQRAVLHTRYSPDAGRLLTVSADRTARLWQARSGDLLTTLGGHESEVLAGMFSRDGTHVATLTSRGTIRVWRQDTQGYLPVVTAHLNDDVIEQASFSADGQWVLARTRQQRWHRWLVRPEKITEQYAWVDDLSPAELRELGLQPP